MEAIKQLKEDYIRRLNTVNEKIDVLHARGDDLTVDRLNAKAMCYRTFISELDKIIRDGKDF